MHDSNVCLWRSMVLLLMLQACSSGGSLQHGLHYMLQAALHLFLCAVCTLWY